MPSYYQQLQNVFRGILDTTVPYLNSFLDVVLQSTPYDYNPHEYVKIWLSGDPDVFMTQANQLRLVRTRDRARRTHTHDVIHLVYDSQLLSEKALSELDEFCKNQEIIPHDVRKDIMPALKTEEERRLMELYEDEVSHLKEGGNLASAADLLRILSPVYAWTYTDFDVEVVDTHKMPETIKVKEPILISLSENGKFCTDVFAVVDPEGALDLIQTIQRAIIAACSPKPTQYVSDDFSPNFLEDNKAFCEKMLNDCLSLGYTVREYRNFVSNIDPLTLHSIILDKIDSFDSFLNSLNSASESEKKMKMEIMIKEAVMNTTGPSIYMRAIEQLCKKNFMNMLLFNRLFSPMSTYHLDEYFKGQSVSGQNDASWLPTGTENSRQQEEKMSEAAIKITRKAKRYIEERAQSKPHVNGGGVEESKEDRSNQLKK
jgi:hypothetical protein